MQIKEQVSSTFYIKCLRQDNENTINNNQHQSSKRCYGYNNDNILNHFVGYSNYIYESIIDRNLILISGNHASDNVTISAARSGSYDAKCDSYRSNHVNDHGSP